MIWDTTATLLLSTVLIQSALFPITLAYYSKVIQPNRDKPFWSIRRPNYFLFYIIITLSNDTVRCTISLLLHNQIINQYWYSLISVPLAYFGGITWGSIRLWLLYYDIKLTRKRKLCLLSAHLTSSSHSIEMSYDPNTKTTQLYFQKKGYLSVIKRVFAAVIMCAVITFTLDIFGQVAISRLLMYAFMLLLLFLYTYFLFKLRCCCCCCKSKGTLETSAFRDDWLLFLELFIIWIMWMIGLFGAFLFLPFRGTSIYPVLIAYLTMITRVIITLTMLILPYKLSQRTKQKCRKKISLPVLKNVLSTKSYFYAFVEHLVHEMAIENLTALVEIWQFKYEHEYHLKPSKMPKATHLNIEKSTEKSTTETDGSWFKTDEATIAYEPSYDAPPVDINAVQFLQSMRWKKLPLAESVALHLSQSKDANNTMDIEQKWKQCEMLYAKYFDESSYDSVNISYSTRYEVCGNYNALSLYVQNKETDADINADGTEIVTPQKIQSDEEFKTKILNTFDSSFHDLMANLQDSLTRFVLTDEFKLCQ